MSGSGGSVSDAPTNKTVSGQRHQLAYITPDEVNTLVDQGGVPTMTNEGVMAYPPQGQAAQHGGVERSSTPSTDNSADRGGNVHRVTAQSTAPVLNVHQTGAVTQTPGRTPDTTETKDSLTELTNPFEDLAFNIEWLEKTYGTGKEDLITKVKNNEMSEKDGWKIANKLGWLTDNSVVNALGGAVSVIQMLGSGAQEKAMTWSLENRIKSQMKKLDLSNPNTMHDPKLVDLQTDLQDVKDGTFSQNDFTAKYGSGDASNPLDASFDPSTARGGDNARGLTNVITPYAAHAIGGTTQQTSQAAQWYANLGSGNSNPGAFDLTAQYAKAKAAVSQRLQNTSSVGQMAVADSAFFNFLKDNSLNKGIL